MEELLGISWPIFIGLTLVLFGGCAFMTGQSLASGWRPAWLALPYALLLAAGDRFLAFALFQRPLLSLTLAATRLSAFAIRATGGV